MRSLVWLAVGTGSILGLPLLGVLLAGRPLAQYLELPPRTVYVVHPGFSWPVATGIFLLVFVTVLTWLFFPGGERRIGTEAPAPEPRAFPWWGWLGVLAGLCTWVLAWNRFAWFTPFQPHVFTPLWVSYTVVVNALTYRRTGRCMLIDDSRFFVLLIPVSALFWWSFEYLNRFVQNWYYLGVTLFGPVEYLIAATFPFATVLPAVLGTEELISTFPVLTRRFQARRPIRVRAPRVIAAATLALSGASLMLVGVLPQFLFPVLWVSPLLILVSLRTLQGRPHLFHEVAEGDWRRFTSSALAALTCGFFWEMWNYACLAKWVYTVPFVDRWHIFEMPLLGYAGYLPFGLECLLIGDLVREVASLDSR